MKNIITLVALALALVAGSAAVLTVHPHQAVACDGGGCTYPAPGL